jgi:hypothetical protein
VVHLQENKIPVAEAVVAATVASMGWDRSTRRIDDRYAVLILRSGERNMTYADRVKRILDERVYPGDRLVNKLFFFAKKHWPHSLVLEKQAETLFRLIFCERKTLFRLKKKQAKKYGL